MSTAVIITDPNADFSSAYANAGLTPITVASFDILTHTNLIAYYPCNEGSGLTLIDQFAGNNATLTGSVAPAVGSAGAASGQAVIPFASTTGISTGMAVSGPGIPAGSTVSSFVTNTSVTISNNLTAAIVAGQIINFGVTWDSTTGSLILPGTAGMHIALPFAYNGSIEIDLIMKTLAQPSFGAVIGPSGTAGGAGYITSSGTFLPTARNSRISTTGTPDSPQVNVWRANAFQMVNGATDWTPTVTSSTGNILTGATNTVNPIVSASQLITIGEDLTNTGVATTPQNMKVGGIAVYSAPNSLSVLNNSVFPGLLIGKAIALGNA